ncbi:tetratricopeptide repeat protein [Aerosakkonema funiforme]|uniref:Tetratricopeptide repeat protein n=2 Tax=Oscillatoriophycideae TaxID=1301283 RepID=A0A926ZHN0_9CYAN|nr:tetratricopeptide repeat protein [Aerosakkonema funiforme]MBD2182347.1 tetratricopeptide repeat protein [Aerosakkonema funiforme FACHB-1375]
MLPLNKASTRIGIAAGIVAILGTGIATYLYFTPSSSSSKRMAVTVLEDCGGFLVNDPQADFLRKTALSDQEKAALQKKIECYTFQIGQDANYADGYTNLGEAYRRLGDVDKARKFHQKAINLNPGLQEAKLGLALVEQESGNPKVAVAAIQEAIGHKENAIAYYYQGVTNYKQGNIKDAEVAFRKAIEMDANYAEAHANLGLILKQQGKLPEAIEQTRQALRIYPDLAQAHYNLGVSLQAQGQTQEAIAAYREAIRVNPNHAEANYNLGVALRNVGKTSEAIAAYREAIRINPKNVTAHINLGTDLTDQGKLEEAISELRKAITLAPEDAEAYNNLGVALYKQNNLTKAISMWEEAIRINPQYAEAHHNLGVALASQVKVEEAIATLKQASDLYRSQGKTQTADKIDGVLRNVGVQ